VSRYETRVLVAVAKLADALTDSLSDEEHRIAVAIRDLAQGEATVDEVATRLGDDYGFWGDL
jgi:hypothetical protein